MSIFRVNKTSNYTVMCNRHIMDRSLSLKAKGLMTVMLSLPDDWDYSISGLVSICVENETAIKSALKELKEHGYLRITKIPPDKTESGRFEYLYDIFETPIENEQEEQETAPETQSDKKQDPQKQGVDFLPLENHPLNKYTKESNTYYMGVEGSTPKKKAKRENEKFVPPSAEEVDEYCKERGNGIDADAFVAHYASNGWMVGKTKMKNWKAAIRTWEIHAKKEAETGKQAPAAYTYRDFEQDMNSKTEDELE